MPPRDPKTQVLRAVAGDRLTNSLAPALIERLDESGRTFFQKSA